MKPILDIFIIFILNIFSFLLLPLRYCETLALMQDVILRFFLTALLSLIGSDETLYSTLILKTIF